MKYVAVLAVLLLSIPAFAQSVDRVIIATDVAAVDALVAKAAGEKAGIPVLVTDNGEITAEIKDQLASLSVKTVILVGGPSVIKPAAAEELLAAGYAVVRLWGIERTGTAIEVAKYFWSSSDCVVLADDTRDSDADTNVQAPASSLASEAGCPLIPVPAGTMPAEVLAMLNDINVSEVKFVAKIAPDTGMLVKYKLKVIAGDKAKLESEVEGEVESMAKAEGKKLKLVIVAAPHWRHAIGIGAHPNDRTVVRFVTNVSQVAELIVRIKEKNITDVRVVGKPDLSQEIAAQLSASGITPKVVSGEKAARIAIDVLKEHREKWAEKRKVFEDRRNAQLAKIRSRLLDRLNDVDKELNDAEVELESLKTEGGDAAKIAEIQARIDTGRTKISGLKADVSSNNVDVTARELEKVREAVRIRQWESRDAIKLNIVARLVQEEEKRDAKDKMVQDNIAAVETRLARLKTACNNTAQVEDLVAKAKSLRDEAKSAVDSGDHGKGSTFLMEAKRVVEAAHRLGNVCEKSGKIESRLQNTAMKRAETAQKLIPRVIRPAATARAA